MKKLRITVLSENTVRKKGLLAEHGFALWVEIGERKILFDTGAGKVIGNNAAVLGFDLAEAPIVVLSHGHYDHTGGLAEVCDRATGMLTVYAHPAAFMPKYSRHPDGMHDIAMPVAAKKAVNQRAEIKLNKQPVEIHSGFYLSGEIPRETDFEDTGGAFSLDAEGQVPDLLIDDQSAFVDTPSGLVVILGCAHSGVVNTLRRIRRLTGDRPVRAVIGGMHLGSATDNRINRTIAEFEKLGIRHLFPAHCTGFEASARLWHKFGKSCSPCSVGTVFEFDC